MRSSLNNPHIYSTKAEFVNASDWNSYMSLLVPIVIDHTVSPYTLNNNIGILIGNTTGGAISVALPNDYEHPLIIRNYGLNNITLTSSSPIEDNLIIPGECLEIVKTSLGWIVLTRG